MPLFISGTLTPSIMVDEIRQTNQSAFRVKFFLVFAISPGKSALLIC